MADISTTTHYSPYAQISHWFTVILVVGAWVLGIFGDDLPRGAIRHYGEFIHIIFGEAVLFLLVLRLALRLVKIQPASEPQIIPFMGYAAKFVHLLLYVLLFSVPVIGILTLFYGGESLTLFGMFDVASPWPKSRELKHNAKEIHELLANLLLSLAGLHAIASLIHHYVLKDGVLKRMLPATWTKE